MRPPADALGERLDPLARSAATWSPAAARALAVDAGDRTVLAEHLAQRVGPLAGGDPRQRALDRRLHQDVAALGRGFSAASAAATRRIARVGRGSSDAIARLDRRSSTLKMPPSSPVVSGEGRPSVHLFRPTTICSPVLMRAHPLGHRPHQRRFM
jgi:hypothetical protein